MKALYLLGLLTFQFTGTMAQRQDQRPIKMISRLTDDSDLKDVLLFQHIDLHKIAFRGASLVGKHFSIVAKEIWNGELKRTDTVFNSNKKGGKELPADSLTFKVIGSKTRDDKLKVIFFFNGFGLQRQFDATPSDAYSLRALDKGLVIQPGKPFYALAYILPYETDGYKLYCDVDTSGKDVESWGKEFDIPHYVIFEMRFF